MTPYWGHLPSSLLLRSAGNICNCFSDVNDEVAITTAWYRFVKEGQKVETVDLLQVQQDCALL